MRPAAAQAELAQMHEAAAGAERAQEAWLGSTLDPYLQP